jgi:hypothetical protein
MKKGEKNQKLNIENQRPWRKAIETVKDVLTQYFCNQNYIWYYEIRARFGRGGVLCSTYKP